MINSPRLWSILAVAILSSLTLGARADEMVENPTYHSWHKFKPKTMVRYKNMNKTNVMGMEIVSETDMTMTLVEVTESKVVVETVTLTKVNGQEYKAPPTRQEYPHMIPLKPGQKKESVGKPDSVFEEGKEKIKVPAGEYETNWHKSKVEDRVLQSWVSDEVPGTLIKSVAISSGERKSANVMELLEIKKP